MKKGFTLAEVLITLGVIGVISAMTLPTLIQTHRNHTVEAKLKKLYSVMNQALNMSEAENGNKADWVNELATMEGTEKYLLPYLKTTKTEEDDDNIYLYLADGGILVHRKNYYYDWYFLTNKKESCMPYDEAGKCQFWFYYKPFDDEGAVHQTEKTKQFEPYDRIKNDLDANTFDWNSACSVKKGDNLQYCTKAIQVNGWKIPKNYAYRVR